MFWWLMREHVEAEQDELLFELLVPSSSVAMHSSHGQSQSFSLQLSLLVWTNLFELTDRASAKILTGKRPFATE